jgi:PAS domain-containing protein
VELGPKTHDEMQAAALRLIGIVYEAAADPARWDDFLQVYSELYPGTSQWIWIEDRERADVRILTSEACDLSYVPSYQEYYAATNPWTETAFSQPEGWVHLGDWEAPREVLEASPFYNDWMKPQDLDNGIGSIILNSGGQMMIYSLLHSKRVATSERDLRLLRMLVPHMQRAARLHGHFLVLEGMAGTNEHLLNRLALGILLCDAGGRILFMNKAAEDMLLAGDGLSIIGGRLVPALKAEADRLDLLVAQASGMANGGGVTAAGACGIAPFRLQGLRPDGRPLPQSGAKLALDDGRAGDPRSDLHRRPGAEAGAARRISRWPLWFDARRGAHGRPARAGTRYR